MYTYENAQCTVSFGTPCSLVKGSCKYICPNGRLNENVFKRISANSNPNLIPNPNSNSNPNRNPNPKTQ